MDTFILLFAVSQVLEGLLLGLALYFLYRRKKNRKNPKETKSKKI